MILGLGTVSTGGEIEVGGFTRTRLFPFPNLVIDKERQNKKAKKPDTQLRRTCRFFHSLTLSFT